MVSGNMLDPARRFLNAFHGIEKALRTRQGADTKESFSSLVRSEKSLTRQQRDRLTELAYLRNAIAHTPYSDDGEPYANPRMETVLWIENQLEVITRPPMVVTALRLRPPEVLDWADRLAIFLALVAEPHNFSQAPYRLRSGELGLLTTNAVARWLASQHEVGQGYMAEDVSVSSVAESASESGDRLVLRSRNLHVVDALNIFAGTDNHVPPAAVLITHAGKGNERPLGIVTASDIPSMAQQLGV